jgi:hypothetical protein
VGKVGLIRDTYQIDFILGDLACDEDHPTSEKISNHPMGYSFPFQAINTFKPMVLFFLWIERCLLHFRGSYFIKKQLVNA